MPTKQELLAEAYKRGILPQAQARAYEQAMQRGILEQAPQAIAPQTPTMTPLETAMQAFGPPAVERAGEKAEERLIGIGRGMTDIAEGLKQTYLEATDPEAAKEYTKQITEERGRFEESPVGKTAQAQMGRFIGSVAPYMVIPGAAGTLPARMAAGAGLGGIIGGTQFVPEEASRAQMAGMGALFGGAAPAAMAGAERLIGKGIGTLRGEYSDPMAQRVVAAGQRHDVPVFAPDISAGPGIRKAATYMEDIPVIGMRGARLAQMEKSQRAAERVTERLKMETVANQYGGRTGMAKLQQAATGSGKRAASAQNLINQISDAGDDWNRIVQTSGNVQSFRSRLIADKKYDKVDKLANEFGAVVKTKSIRALNDAIEEAQESVLPNQGLINTLQNLKTNLGEKELNYSGMRMARSDLSNEIETYYRGAHAVIGEKGAGLLQKVKGAIESDMDDFARVHGPELKRAWKQADTFYKKNVVPYKDRQLATALKNVDPDEIYGKFVARGKGDRASRFYKALDSKGQAAVRYGMASNALEKATDVERQIFSPAKFATELKRIQEARGVFFTGKAKTEMDGFVNLMRHVERSGQVFEMPPTGMRNVPFLMGGAFAGAYAIEPTVAASAIGMTALMKRLFTTDAGRRILLSSSKAKPETPAMRALLSRVNDMAARGAAIIGADIGREQ